MLLQLPVKVFKRVRLMAPPHQKVQFLIIRSTSHTQLYLTKYSLNFLHNSCMVRVQALLVGNFTVGGARKKRRGRLHHSFTISVLITFFG